MLGRLPKSQLNWEHAIPGLLRAFQIFQHNWNYVATETNFTFLFAILWWYVSPFAIPPITNLLTVFILTSHRYRGAAAALATTPLRKIAFYSAFGIVTFKRSADVFYFGTSFLYKCIILESKMGPRRFIFVTMLLMITTGVTKYICEHTDLMCIAGGPFVTLMALKIITHRWAYAEQPIRFPYLLSIIARRLPYLEYLIIPLLCGETYDVCLGIIVGLAISQLRLTENRSLIGLLGKVVTLPYTRVLLPAPRRVGQVVLYFLPRVSACLLVGASITQYFCHIFPEGINLFCAIPSGQIYLLLVPSFGAVNLTHLIYICSTAYIVMYQMQKIFVKQYIMIIYCVFLQVVTNLLFIVCTNLAYRCPPFSNECVPPGTEIVGISSTLLAIQVFAGIMRHKAEWRNYALTALRACGEVVLIYAFLPEADARLHLVGAGAGFALACTHQRPPPFIKQQARPSDIMIERPHSRISTKITGRKDSLSLVTTETERDDPSIGRRRSRLRITTRKGKTPPVRVSKAPLVHVCPTTPEPAIPVVPPKVILILGNNPPMYVPVMQQGQQSPMARSSTAQMPNYPQNSSSSNYPQNLSPPRYPAGSPGPVLPTGAPPARASPPPQPRSARPARPRSPR